MRTARSTTGAYRGAATVSVCITAGAHHGAAAVQVYSGVKRRLPGRRAVSRWAAAVLLRALAVDGSVHAGACRGVATVWPVLGSGAEAAVSAVSRGAAAGVILVSVAATRDRWRVSWNGGGAGVRRSGAEVAGSSIRRNLFRCHVSSSGCGSSVAGALEHVGERRRCGRCLAVRWRQ